MADGNGDAGDTALVADDFEAIEAAVMETARGRWFLSEFARRNRSADTAMLLDAIGRLEQSLARGPGPAPDAAALRQAIVEMSEDIAAAKREIAGIGRKSGDGGEITDATSELDAIVETTEGAASDILEAAEAIQELAWTLREEGIGDAYCEALDRHATEIYTACSFQDLTGQRTRKVVRLLQTLEQRISTLAGIWSVRRDDAPAEACADDRLLNGPAGAGEGVRQEEIDQMMVENADECRDDPTGGATAGDPVPAGAEAEISPTTPVPDPRLDLYGDPPEVAVARASLEVPFDSLSQADRDALFV